MKKFLVAAAFVVFGLSAANAQSYSDRYNNPRRDYHGHDDYNDGRNRAHYINNLQREAREAIDRGIRSGRLSRREAHSLSKQYDHIAHTERKFSSRGKLSEREARILANDLDRLISQTYQLSRRHGDNWARGNRGRY